MRREHSGKVGPLLLKGRTRPGGSGPTACWFDSAIETPPAEYGLAMLASSGKSDCEVEQVKGRISPAGLRVYVEFRIIFEFGGKSLHFGGSEQNGEAVCFT